MINFSDMPMVNCKQTSYFSSRHERANLDNTRACDEILEAMDQQLIAPMESSGRRAT